MQDVRNSKNVSKSNATVPLDNGRTEQLLDLFYKNVTMYNCYQGKRVDFSNLLNGVCEKIIN